MGSKALTLLALLPLAVTAAVAEEKTPSEVFSQSVEVLVVNIASLRSTRRARRSPG